MLEIVVTVLMFLVAGLAVVGAETMTRASFHLGSKLSFLCSFLSFATVLGLIVLTMEAKTEVKGFFYAFLVVVWIFVGLAEFRVARNFRKRAARISRLGDMPPSTDFFAGFK